MSLPEHYTWTYKEKCLLMALVDMVKELGGGFHSPKLYQRILFCFPDRTELSLKDQWKEIGKPGALRSWKRAKHLDEWKKERNQWTMEPKPRARLIKLRGKNKSWEEIASKLHLTTSHCRGHWINYIWKTPGELDLTRSKIDPNRFLALEKLEHATTTHAAADSQALTSGAPEEKRPPTTISPNAAPAPLLQEDPATLPPFIPGVQQPLTQPKPTLLLPSIQPFSPQPDPPSVPAQAHHTSAQLLLPVLPRSAIDTQMIARLDGLGGLSCLCISRRL